MPIDSGELTGRVAIVGGAVGPGQLVACAVMQQRLLP